MHVTTVLSEKYMDMVGQKGGKDLRHAPAIVVHSAELPRFGLSVSVERRIAVIVDHRQRAERRVENNSPGN